MCRHACPVSTASGRETYIPQAKMDRLNQLRLGRSAWTTESTDPLWACTGCRHCTMYCDHGNEPGLVLFTGRAAAVERGVPHPGARPATASGSARASSGWPRSSRPMFREQLATRGRASGSGPAATRSTRAPATSRRRSRCSSASGSTDVKLVEAPQACAGYPLLAAGHRDLFRWHAGRVAASLRGFRKVAINCSACLYAMRAQYAAEGVNVRDRGRVARRAARARRAATSPARSTARSVYYHDPCYHARYNGVVEQPRRALAQLAEVREFVVEQDRHRVLRRRRPAAQDDAARRRSDGEAPARRGAGGRRRHGRDVVRDVHVHAQAQRAAVGRGREPGDRDGAALGDAVHAAAELAARRRDLQRAVTETGMSTRRMPGFSTRQYHRI